MLNLRIPTLNSLAQSFFSQTPNAEGLGWNEYNHFALAAAVPPAAAVFLCGEMLKKTVAIVDTFDDINNRMPDNAIVYLMHSDIWVSAVSTQSLARIFTPESSYLGYHGYLSYLGSGWSYALGLKCYRYDRKSSLSARDQVLSFVEKTPGRFFLRTDAGGPYGRVRASLVDMALAANKPLVPLRQFATRHKTFKHHQIPLAGAQIHVCTGEPLWPEDLTKLPREEARAMLQKSMDSLRCPV